MLQEFLTKQGAIMFPWQDGISISVLKKPKSILTDPNNKEVIDNIINDLEVITTESFGTELEKQTDDGVRNHVIDVDTLGFIHEQDRILGFASSRLFPKDKLFYLHGVAIAKNFKSKGGGTALVKKLADIANLPRIAFTTQNPIMFRLLRNLCSEVYPYPERKKIPKEIKILGKRIIDGRSNGLDRETLVVDQLYGRCLYNKIPDCHDRIINQWFEKSLSIKNGITRNAFLFIGNRK
ncbi:MAG: GNAT family N-acetyltransferase [Minisyncoccales bacterium]